MLSIREEVREGVVVLYFEGELEASVEEEVSVKVEQIAGRGLGQKLILDVGDMKMIDSAGIGVIVGFFKRLRSGGGDLKLARLGGQPLQIFKLLRLDRAIEPCDSVAAALSRFASATSPSGS